MTFAIFGLEAPVSDALNDGRHRAVTLSSSAHMTVQYTAAWNLHARRVRNAGSTGIAPAPRLGHCPDGITALRHRHSWSWPSFLLEQHMRHPFRLHCKHPVTTLLRGVRNAKRGRKSKDPGPFCPRCRRNYQVDEISLPPNKEQIKNKIEYHRQKQDTKPL